jgi:hypothetical protein
MQDIVKSKVETLFISGDTGPFHFHSTSCPMVPPHRQRFRGVPVAWFHSTLSAEYGLDVEQVPLSPRRAHSSADRGIARLNKFFRRLMRLTYQRGAQQFTEALKLATDPSLTGPRRLLKNISQAA